MFPRSHPPFDTPSLTVATPPSSSQVLLVMKDSARSTPAKKLLEDIGYKGASTAPRATRRDRGSSACTFLEGGLVPRSRFFFPRGTPRGASARRANRPARAPGPRPPPPRPRPRARDPAASHRACATVPAREARAPSPPPRPGRIEGSRGAQLTAGSGGDLLGNYPGRTDDGSRPVEQKHSFTLRPRAKKQTIPRRSDPIPDPFSDAHRDPPFPFALRLALLNSLGRADARRGPDLDRVREGRRVVV